MQHEVKFGESIYDVAVITYGDAQYSVKLCTDNNITITDDIVGMSLVYDDNLKPQIVTNNISTSFVQVAPNLDYSIKENQSNYDLSIQFGYGIDKYGEFIKLANIEASQLSNAGINISVTTLPNKLGNNIFATLYDEASAPPITGGIGFMIIESTFIIA